MICLGSVAKVAIAKYQNLTLQVENTAVEKWEGITENRTISTIFEEAVRVCVGMGLEGPYQESTVSGEARQCAVVEIRAFEFDGFSSKSVLESVPCPNCTTSVKGVFVEGAGVQGMENLLSPRKVPAATTAKPIQSP